MSETKEVKRETKGDVQTPTPAPAPAPIITVFIQLSPCAVQLAKDHPDFFPSASHVLQHYVKPLFDHHVPYGAILLTDEKPVRLPSDAAAYVERDSKGDIIVRKPLPITMMKTAGYDMADIDSSTREEHVCVFFQCATASATRRVVVSGRSTFQPHTDKKSDIPKLDAMYHIGTDKKMTPSAMDRVQAYHDVCALWGRGTAGKRPPWLLASQLEQAIKLVNESSFVSAHIVEDIRKRVLHEHTGEQSTTGEMTRACLLHGPPGTGKTRLVLDLLPLAGVRVVWYGTGAQLNDKWVGETEQAIMRRFAACRDTPNILCAVIIDEIDTLTGARGSGDGQGSSKEGHRLDWTSLMLRLVGSSDYPNLLVVGMTNRESAMDDAFVRFGRFGPRFFVGALDGQGRFALLKRLVKERKLFASMHPKKAWVEAATLGFTAAMIDDVVKRCVLTTQDCRLLANEELVTCVRAVVDDRRSVPASLLHASSYLVDTTEIGWSSPPRALVTSVVPLLSLPHLSGGVPSLSSTWAWWTRGRQLHISTSTGVLVACESQAVTDAQDGKGERFPFDGLVVGFAQQTHRIDQLVVVSGVPISPAAANASLLQAAEQCAAYINQGATVLLWINLDHLLEWQRQEITTETKGAQTNTQESPATTSTSEHWTVTTQTHGHLVHASVLQALVTVLKRFQRHAKALIVVQTDNRELYSRVAAAALWSVELGSAQNRAWMPHS